MLIGAIALLGINLYSLCKWCIAGYIDKFISLIVQLNCGDQIINLGLLQYVERRDIPTWVEYTFCCEM